MGHRKYLVVPVLPGLKVPRRHSFQSSAPSATSLNGPGGHLTHLKVLNLLSCLDLCLFRFAVPEGHFAHLDPPNLLEYLPSGHSLQRLVAGLSVKSPGRHCWHPFLRGRLGKILLASPFEQHKQVDAPVKSWIWGTWIVSYESLLNGSGARIPSDTIRWPLDGLK